ncbi:glycerophosphodiester phosphodiesterase [Flavobacterium alkalisoli]|uniref:Glycerophosphodiester phosphodiesterase n=1 Tax=Flavobacterium alkalisoli TaxID=2602769 RepID=A0A5B9FWW2_9FLAO|nr:glycerophosphodiester phosphodiesterase family protein [Flavobacterium alkalisoli]QEE49212.1 glycerophosphodiester phosphodiesterase [Flavobacterium alkalisoli]
MKHLKAYLAITLAAGMIACKSDKKTEEATETETAKIEVQGHRGDRGNFPENTIPAFLSAVKKGADVLELDVVISKDGKVVVSHEPFMSSVYVTTPKGDSITKENERSYNLHLMMYDSIKKFDTGSKGNKNFPEQQKMNTYKPLLSEMIDTVESYIKANNLKPVRYNIEIKSDAKEYGNSQPQPSDFVDMVMQVVNEKGIAERINIQSFDPTPLNILRKKYPQITIAFLTGEPGIDKNLSQLDFVPEIYSPHYNLVNKAFTDSIKGKNMRLIPWTVNNPEDIDRMIELKVNGIITDYPERVLNKL